MKRKISKRDITVFFLGLLAAFLINLVANHNKLVETSYEGANAEIGNIDSEYIGL